MVTYVLAKNPNQYNQFIKRAQGIFRNVVNITDIRGLHGQKIIILSGAESRADYQQIMDYLTMADFNVVRAT